jgi:hypothetical protein
MHAMHVDCSYEFRVNFSSVCDLWFVLLFVLLRLDVVRLL